MPGNPNADAAATARFPPVSRFAQGRRRKKNDADRAHPGGLSRFWTNDAAKQCSPVRLRPSAYVRV